MNSFSRRTSSGSANTCLATKATQSNHCRSGRRQLLIFGRIRNGLWITCRGWEILFFCSDILAEQIPGRWISSERGSSSWLRHLLFSRGHPGNWLNSQNQKACEVGTRCERLNWFRLCLRVHEHSLHMRLAPEQQSLWQVLRSSPAKLHRLSRTNQPIRWTLASLDEFEPNGNGRRSSKICRSLLPRTRGRGSSIKIAWC